METGPYSFQALSPPRHRLTLVKESLLDGSAGDDHRSGENNSQLRYYASSKLTSSSMSVASDSSMSSSCGLITPPVSFTGLRRSTFDLSDYHSNKKKQSGSLRYRGRTSSSSSLTSMSAAAVTTTTSSARPLSAHAGAATRALLEMAMHDALSPAMRTRSSSQEFRSAESNSSFSNQYTTSDPHSSSSFLPSSLYDNNKNKATNDHRCNHDNESPRFLSGLEALIKDLLLGYLTFLHVVIVVERHVRRSLQLLREVVTSWSDAIRFEEPIDRTCLHECGPSRDSLVVADDLDQTTTSTTTQSDEVKGSLRTANESSGQQNDVERDEWGHFADFQDELADESSFIASCNVSLNPEGRRSSKITTTSLQTLTEISEDDVDDDEVGYKRSL